MKFIINADDCGVKLDGKSTIFNIPFFPKLICPRKSSPFLSTYKGEI